MMKVLEWHVLKPVQLFKQQTERNNYGLGDPIQKVNELIGVNGKPRQNGAQEHCQLKH